MRLHELDLPIGHKVSLKLVGLDYKAHAFEAELMGFQKGESVALTLISKPGQVLLHKGLKATVEMQLDTGYLSFDSEIDEVMESPFLHLHLEYPLSVNLKTVRDHVRIPVDEPVEICGYTGLGMTTSTMSGYMLDVSEGGARLVLEKELTAMVTKLSIGVQLSAVDLSRDITLMAQVRNPAKTSEDYPECQFAYGVEFIEVGDLEALFLRCFCQQEQARKRIVPLSK